METQASTPVIGQNEVIHTFSDGEKNSNDAMNADAQKMLARQSLVQIWGGNKDEPSQFLGTGFFISKTMIATCRHVVFPKCGSQLGKLSYARLKIKLLLDGSLIKCKRSDNWDNEIHDLAILEIVSPPPAYVVPLPLLSGVMMHHKELWCMPNWHFLGYSQNDFNGSPKHYELTNRTGIGNILGIPTDVHLPEVGIAEGGSGSPILIKVRNEWVCTGLMTKGGSGKPISIMSTSSIFLHLIDAHLRLNLKTTDISEFLPSPIIDITTLEKEQDEQHRASASTTRLKIISKFYADKKIYYISLLILFTASAVASHYYYKRQQQLALQINQANQVQCEELKKEAILIAKFKPTSVQTLSRNFSEIIKGKLYDYLNAQHDAVIYRDYIRVLPIDEVIDASFSDAQLNAIMTKYNAGTIIWGEYSLTGNLLTIKSYAKSTLLNKAIAIGESKYRESENIDLDDLLSLLGKQPIALIHLKLGVISQNFHKEIDAAKQYQAYEYFDKNFIDNESMFNRFLPNYTLITSIAHAYRKAGFAESFDELMERAKAACPPDRSDCKGYYDSGQGCAEQVQGKNRAAKEHFSRAERNLRASGKLFEAACQICNKASLVEGEGAVQEALALWQKCEGELRKVHNPDDAVLHVLGRAILAIGRIYYAQCDKDLEAKNYLLQLAPVDNKDKTYAQAMFYLSKIDRRAGQLSDALIKVDKALDYLPGNAEDFDISELRQEMLGLQRELELEVSK